MRIELWVDGEADGRYVGINNEKQAEVLNYVCLNYCNYEACDLDDCPVRNRFRSMR